MPIHVSGATYRYKHQLKSMNGRFDGNMWILPDGSDIDRLKSFIGCAVNIVVEPEYQPTRSSDIIYYGNCREYAGRFQADTYLHAGFETLHDLVEFVNETSLSTRLNRHRGRAWERDTEGFMGTLTMNDAADLIEHGWSEGVQVAQDVTELLQGKKAERKRRKSTLAGGRVNIGKMLAGNPIHMTSRVKQPGSKVVTLFVNLSAGANIEAVTLGVRAAIVAAICDELERQAFSCEIVAYDISYHSGLTFNMTCKLKNAGEALNLEDMTFALGHPSMLRRFGFGVMGRIDELAEFCSFGYGSPRNGFKDGESKLKRNEFHIGQIMNNPSTADFERCVYEMFEMTVPKRLPVKLKAQS